MKKGRMKSVALFAAFSMGAFFTAPVLAQNSDLLISEYVEGTGFEKYVEIYNGTGASVDLSNYEIRLYANGTAIPTISNTLSGTLANGATIVYKNNQATAYTGVATSLTSMNFNGDDAIELYNIEAAESVDIFGVIGCDPGANWSSASNQTSDRTLRRSASITSGISTNPACTSSPSDFTSLEAEWSLFSTDDVSNLGIHGGSSNPSGCPTDLFFSEYIEGSGNNKCLEIINKTGASVDLGANGYRVDMYFNGNTSASTTIYLSGVVANNDVYVLCHDAANATLLAQADQVAANNFYNGDDAVVLAKGSVTLDIIGEIGSDPGASWSAGGLATKDRTLVRNSDVTHGVTINATGFPTLTSEWSGYANNYSDSLGKHFVDCNGSNPPTNDPDFLLISNTQPNQVGFLVDGQDVNGNQNDDAFIGVANASLVQVSAYAGNPGTGSEVIAFTEKSPVIVQTGVNWTAASDTIPVDLDTAAIDVPITIWIVYAPNGDFAAQSQKALLDLMTTQVNFEKERLGFNFSNVTIIDATNDPDAPNYYNFTCGMRSGLESDIGNNPNHINVYYLQTVDGSTTRGQSCTIGSNFAALGSNAGVELQSHEIGHNLYLFHIDALTAFGFNQTNIMHSASNTRQYFTEGQTFRAHVAPQSSINDTYNARPGGVTRSCSPTSTSTTDFGCPAIQTRIWTDQ